MRRLSYVVSAEHAGMTVKEFARNYLRLSARAFTRQKYLQAVSYTHLTLPTILRV